MDNKKDNNNQPGFYIGHTDNRHPENLEKIIESANSFVSFSYKRAEQIGTAVYMVSECFEEREPLKETLRETVLDIIGEVHVLHALPPFESFMHFEVLHGRINELLSFISVAKFSGLISQNNSEILIREIEFFSSVLSYVRDRGMGYRVSRENKSMSLPIESLFKEEVSGNNSQGFLNKRTFEQKDINIKQKDLSTVIQNKISHKGHQDSKSSEKDTKISRRNSILKVIKDKKSVTIKDIMSVISDCSEKTIQRELVSLMKDGILKREGEKRWAKYSLK